MPTAVGGDKQWPEEWQLSWRVNANECEQEQQLSHQGTVEAGNQCSVDAMRFRASVALQECSDGEEIDGADFAHRFEVVQRRD